jgi:hypothetical protein
MASKPSAVFDNSVPRVRTCGAARPFQSAEGLVGPQPRVRLCCVMGHGPAAFKESDVVRAVKALVKAGQSIARIEFNRDGGFTVMVGQPGEQEAAKLNDNEVEDWITKHVHSS